MSSRMAVVQEDEHRPGFVDVASLLTSCKEFPPTSVWPVAELDFITSSKTEQLYPNSCNGPSGSRPKGFMPGSHAATAEFFALYYQHCMAPTTRNRYLMEVANECGVKVPPSRCNTTWSEMIGLHIAVADALHAAHANATPPTPYPMVCGPTAAFPEYQASNFSRWRENGPMSQFVQEAGGHVDCMSVHLYDTFLASESVDPFEGNFSTHDGSNLEATLDLQEVGTALMRPHADGGSSPSQGAGAIPAITAPLPMLFSEYGGGMSGVQYSTAHDWWVMRGVTAKLFAFLSRPDRILRALPFIVNKASWDKSGMANNASQSYPFVLWRNVTTAAALEHFQQKEAGIIRTKNSNARQQQQQRGPQQRGPAAGAAAAAAAGTTTSEPDQSVKVQVAALATAGAAGWVWLPTELHKWYEAWQDLDGERFSAQSNSANILVHGFTQQHARQQAAATRWGQASGTDTGARKPSATFRVVVHNLDFHEEQTEVALAWLVPSFACACACGCACAYMCAFAFAFACACACACVFACACRFY